MTTREQWLALAAVVLLWYFFMRKPSPASSDTDLSQVSADPSTWPSGDRIWDVCRAVAQAEGYMNGSGAAPYDLNNPGDLSPGDENGFATAGDAEYHGGSSIIHFATPQDGWQALYAKFSRIANGSSRVYSADSSWLDIATTYAGSSVAWANNVCAALGVDTGSTLRDYLEG